MNKKLEKFINRNVYFRIKMVDDEFISTEDIEEEEVEVPSTFKVSGMTDVELAEVQLFSEVFSTCTIEHLKVCNCQKQRVDIAKEKWRFPILKELHEINKQNLQHNSLEYYDRLDRANENAIAEVALMLSQTDQRCLIEQQLVLKVLERFDVRRRGKYDLTDSNVFMILRSTINHLLSAHRLQLVTGQTGLMLTVRDANGNERVVINPAEALKREFDNSIIEAVEVLNKIVNGEKQLNLNVDVTNSSPMDINKLLNDATLFTWNDSSNQEVTNNQKAIVTNINSKDNLDNK